MFFHKSVTESLGGVENIGQCGRLSQHSWLWAHFNIVTYLLTYLLQNNLTGLLFLFLLL